MKSFLDRFRRKGPEPTKTGPAAPESSLKNGDESAQETSASKTPIQTEEVPPPFPAAPPVANRPQDTTIHLELGDFLHRIPHELLKPGQHDRSAELRFDVTEISTRLARGETTIKLSDVYQRLPAIFAREIQEADDLEIRFPWQKMLDLLLNPGLRGKGPGISEEAAETLAEKLQSRKSKRVPIQQPPSPPPPAPTAPLLTSPPPPVPAPPPTPLPSESWVPTPIPDKAKLGRELNRGKEPSWFTKPPVEHTSIHQPSGTSAEPSSEAVAPAAEAAPVSDSAKPLNPDELAAPEELRAAVQEIAPKQEDPTPAPVTAAPAPDPGAEAMMIADRARTELAEMQAEYERQLMAMAQELQVVSDDRKRISDELENIRKALVAQTEQIEAQKTQNARTGENAAKAIGEREALQKELAVRNDEVTTLQQLVQSLQLDGGPKAAEIAKERDALLEEKNHLAEQLAKLKALGSIETERTKFQRQIDELNRRILAHESSQKETAQELTRERETRIKLERSLQATERVRQETAAMVESLRTETRREVDNAIRKRDAEAAKAQKELQERLDAAAELQRKTTLERDEITARFKELQISTSAEARQAEADNRFAALQAEIEDFRLEIAALTQEREYLARENTELAAERTQLHAALDAEAASFAKGRVADETQIAKLREEITELRKSAAMAGQEELEQLRTRLEALQLENAELKTNIGTAEKSPAEPAAATPRKKRAPAKPRAPRAKKAGGRGEKSEARGQKPEIQF